MPNKQLGSTIHIHVYAGLPVIYVGLCGLPGCMTNKHSVHGSDKLRSVTIILYDKSHKSSWGYCLPNHVLVSWQLLR